MVSGILVLPSQESWLMDDAGTAVAEISPRLYLEIVLYPAQTHVSVISGCGSMVSLIKRCEGHFPLMRRPFLSSIFL